MFSGIIYDTGTIKSMSNGNKQKRICIALNKEIINPCVGMSIAVNGTCLTAAKITEKKEFSADATEETVKKTNLKILKYGDKVNIEFPLTADALLSGHIVQGHIDCTGKVRRIIKKAAYMILEVAFPREFIRYVVEKGSVAADGISLTAYNVKGNSFQVSIIPETLNSTVIKYYKIGTIVNIEFDIIGKYIEKMIKLK